MLNKSFGSLKVVTIAPVKDIRAPARWQVKPKTINYTLIDLIP
jgi:hypothetical protein